MARLMPVLPLVASTIVEPALIKPARFYCEICDEVQPGLLERVEVGLHSNEVGVLLVCAGCFDGKTMLFAGAAASTP